MILCVSVSHRTAGTEILGRLTIPAADMANELDAIAVGTGAAECFVLSTCNRVEIYVYKPAAHAELSQAELVAGNVILQRLANAAGLPIGELAGRALVLSEPDAIAHLNAVACGLDSMVLGETQIVSQIRLALSVGLASGHVGHVLGTAVRWALRVSKAVRSTTELHPSATSLVEVGLQVAAESLGRIAGRSALVIGAGRTGQHAARALHAAEVASIRVANRTHQWAAELALEVGGSVVPLDQLRAALTECDLVVSSTGAPGWLLGAHEVTAAMSERPHRPLFILDLAVPADIEPAAATVENVTLLDIERLGRHLGAGATPGEPASARRLIDEAAARFVLWRLGSTSVPAIGALRAAASQLVDGEVRRLDDRLPHLDVITRRETHAAVHRAVNKLLHTPTVRVRELASGPEGQTYVNALTKLFDLDPTGTL